MSEEEEDVNIDPYHGLTRLDPNEWLNIPRPIIESLRIFKDLAIEHTNKLQDFSLFLQTQQTAINEDLKKINREITLLRHSLTKTQEESMIRIEEVNTNILSELTKFKASLLTDLDYKQKNNDSKIAYLEEQIFHIRKATNAMPTIMEIEHKINDACAELRVKVKSEIKETMILPEVRGLAYDIRENTQNIKAIINETEEKLIEKNVKVLDSIDYINADIDKMSKKMYAFGGKQIEVVDGLTLASRRIDEVKDLLETVDRIQSSSVLKVDSKFVPVNKALEGVELDVKHTNQKVAEIERQMEISRDLLMEFESNLAEIMKAKQEVVVINNAQMKKSESENSKDLDSDDDRKYRKSNGLTSSYNNSASLNDKAIQDFKTELNDLKATLLQNASETNEKLSKEVSNSVQLLNDKVQQIRQENEESFKTLNEKLSWFPVNVNQMSGMNANEARLFTLEARLRSEENTRIKSFNFLGKLIESLKESRDHYKDRLTYRDRRDTPEGIFNVEILKKIGDHERRASVDYNMGTAEASINDDHLDSIRRHYKTPKTREVPFDFFTREARTSSVMGRRVLKRP